MGSLFSAPPSLEPQLSLPLSLQFLSSLTQPGSPSFPAVDKALVSGVGVGAVRALEPETQPFLHLNHHGPPASPVQRSLGPAPTCPALQGLADGWKPTRTFFPAGQSLTPGGQGEECPEGPLFKAPQNFRRQDGQGEKAGDRRRLVGVGWNRTKELSSGRKIQTHGDLLPGSHS